MERLLVHLVRPACTEEGESPEGNRLDAGCILDRAALGSPDATDGPREFCCRVGEGAYQELAGFLREARDQRFQRRHEQYRRLGLT